MKKSKKVGNRTDSNFFTSEFKLTSTQFPKHHRQHKMFSTFSQMKQGFFDEESKKSKKSQSKEGRPVIEQLRLLTCTKEDDFKLPHSFSKRSTSKNLDKSREKKPNTTEIFQNFYQETRVVEQKKRSMGYMQCVIAQRKFKPLSVKNLMKDKLEKTALEKFKDAVSNENNQSQNQINEKNAEALYILLKSARKRQEHDRPPNINQNLLRQDSSDNRLRLDIQTPNEKQNKLQAIKSFESKRDEKSSKYNLYRFQQTREESTGIQDMISRNTKELLGKLKNNGLQQSAIQQKPNVLLEFDNKEKFEDSQEEEFSDIELGMNSKVTRKSEKDKKSTKALAQPQPNAKYSKQILKKEQFSNEKPIQQQEYKRAIQKQKEDFDILIDIPSAKGISSSEKAITNNKDQKQNRQVPPIKPNNYQKEDLIAKQKYTAQQMPIMHANPQKPLGAPPKLNEVQNMPKKNTNRVDYRSQDADQDQLEEIVFDEKKKTNSKKEQVKCSQPQSKPPVKQQIKPQVNKQALFEAKPETKAVNKPLPQPSAQKASAVGQPLKPQEQSSFDPLDELEYFIQKIQDIGQYRINSKDLYNDKSISKQLIESYKICSYYMAHHFLYLSKRACDLFKTDVITKDFYTITAQEINELKKEGQLQFLLETTETNMQEAKKLLKKCYEQSKPLLKKQQQILLLDGKTNYHLKCCTSLIKEFRLIYNLYEKKPDSETIQKRCCFLIEMFSTLKLLNGQEIKECLELSEIKDYREHVKTYKNLLLAS